MRINLTLPNGIKVEAKFSKDIYADSFGLEIKGENIDPPDIDQAFTFKAELFQPSPCHVAYLRGWGTTNPRIGIEGNDLGKTFLSTPSRQCIEEVIIPGAIAQVDPKYRDLATLEALHAEEIHLSKLISNTKTNLESLKSNSGTSSKIELVKATLLRLTESQGRNYRELSYFSSKMTSEDVEAFREGLISSPDLNHLCE